MKKTASILFVFFLALSTLQTYAQSRKEFIHKYKHIAISEMERTGIPASIKLAQGILESGCGASDLSTQACNYFGIKCNNWEGETFHMDDDLPEECFRKYNNPEQSWIDHSEFLTTRPRYSQLFELSTTDYRSWAKGLKAAGYATNPQYADKLIKIIEEEELYQYDKKIKNPTHAPRPNLDDYAQNNNDPDEVTDEVQTGKADEYRDREEMINGTTCILAQEGDTYDKIAKYYNTTINKLLVFNDKMDRDLVAGDYVYLNTKKNKAARGYSFHRVKPGDTLRKISQQYGVRLERLAKYNYINENTEINPGEKIYMRGSAELF